MPAQSKMKSIEAEWKRPMHEILMELYDHLGSQTEVARTLGVGQSTISTWLSLLGLQEKTILVPRKREEVRIIDDRPQIAAAQLPSIQRTV